MNYLEGMKDSTRNILRGIGSIFDIMPSRPPVDFSRLMPKGTTEERLAASWNRVGDSIKKAMERIEIEQHTSKEAGR